MFKQFQSRFALLFGALIFMMACAAASQAIHTITDIAHLLCLAAASERTSEQRSAQSDDSWCASHAIEYLTAVKQAKATADQRAGLGN